MIWLLTPAGIRSQPTQCVHIGVWRGRRCAPLEPADQDRSGWNGFRHLDDRLALLHPLSGSGLLAGSSGSVRMALTAGGETHVSAEAGQFSRWGRGARLTRRVREEYRVYSDRNATQNAAKRSGSAGMDRRSNAAWVLPQAVSSLWWNPGERRERPVLPVGARRPADKAREEGIPSVFRPKRNAERRKAAR